MGGAKINPEALALVRQFFNAIGDSAPRMHHKFYLRSERDIQCSADDIVVAFGAIGYRNWSMPQVESRGPREFKLQTHYKSYAAGGAFRPIYDTWS